MMRALLIFGAGYVLGARAGRERYAQIEDVAKKVRDRVSASGDAVASPAHRH